MTYLIPRSLTLPFGYRVTIKQVPFEEILHGGGEQGALWCVETRTLLIDQDLPLIEKRYWVMSQLHHIVLDANHEMLDAGLIAPTSDVSTRLGK